MSQLKIVSSHVWIFLVFCSTPKICNADNITMKCNFKFEQPSCINDKCLDGCSNTHKPCPIDYKPEDWCSTGAYLSEPSIDCNASWPETEPEPCPVAECHKNCDEALPWRKVACSSDKIEMVPTFRNDNKKQSLNQYDFYTFCSKCTTIACSLDPYLKMKKVPDVDFSINGSVFEVHTIKFHWSRIREAFGYIVMLECDNGFHTYQRTSKKFFEFITGNYESFGKPATCQMRVAACSDDCSAYSQPVSVFIIPPPPNVNLREPADEAVTSIGQIIFSWESAGSGVVYKFLHSEPVPNGVTGGPVVHIELFYPTKYLGNETQISLTFKKQSVIKWNVIPCTEGYVLCSFDDYDWKMRARTLFVNP